MNKVKFIKLIWSKFFYSTNRKLSEFPGVCDFCDCKVGFSDYFYICKKHGDIFWNSVWKYFPKFLFRLKVKIMRKDCGNEVKKLGEKI